MDYKEITDLIRLIGKTNIADLTIERGDFKIRLRTAEGMPAGTVVAAPVPVQMPVSAPAPAAAAAPVTPAAAAPVQASATPAPPPQASSDYITVKSPMVGTLYRRPSPDKDLFVQVGDKVSPGTMLCVIEAMKLFNEIESEVSGTIVKVFPDDASPVEYDQPLFLIDPKG
jgi:acetyl-CoA carboxylase biotin carboxyl carrier protein